jgi:hypothetical protein
VDRNDCANRGVVRFTKQRKTVTMSESAVNVFLSWVEHRAITIWSRDAFGFEFESVKETNP